MFLLGVSLSSYFLTFVIGNQIASRKTQGTSIGIVNMISVGTAPLLQPLVGYILDINHHSGQAYSLAHYQYGLLIIPVGLVLAAVIGRYLPARQL